MRQRQRPPFTPFRRSHLLLFYHFWQIMRCFPHCCPDHMPRRYCGCSVHLLVTFSCELEQIREEELLVCARFEASVPSDASSRTSRQPNHVEDGDGEAVLFPRGQSVRLPSYLFDPADTSGGDATWVRAEKESDTRQQQAPKVWRRV